ncbi:integrase [Actinoallomurus sp. NPDC050550]|uniref:integrase n=1 Tax=Actinoallomurus sp. NPDC050550 TaxID=3154937 RepID=UPI00340ED593
MTTTDPLRAADPDVVVLRGRTIRAGTPATQLSRFGDQVWILQPAHPDAHQGVNAVHWEPFPAHLVPLFKTFALAVLDHPVPAEWAVSTGVQFLGVQTFSTRMLHLRVFATWMNDHGLKELNVVTDRHLERYRSHVLALDCRPKRRADLLNAVLMLHNYREYLPPSCQLATRAAPWGGTIDYDQLGPIAVKGENKTPKIASATMENLLAWSLWMIEEAGPDIVAAHDFYQQIRTGTHPSQQRYAGLGETDRLRVFLDHSQRDQTPLPGTTTSSGTVEPNDHYLGQLLGASRPDHYVRKSPVRRRMLAEASLPINDKSHLGSAVTGTINGKPWRDEPIALDELADLVRLLFAAGAVIVCYLSGMRPGECLNLRKGCRDTDPDSGELLLNGRRGKGRGRTPAPDQPRRHAEPHKNDDPLKRPWVVVQPVHDAIAVLERFAFGDLIFPAKPMRSVRSGFLNNRARSSAYMAQDINDFVDWVNRTFTTTDQDPPIPPDSTKHLHLSRFRRTLAYFIVRQPRGLIAAALQYGHVSTLVTLNYSGSADTEWMNELAVERLEMVVEQTEEDTNLLDDGEHVSGPAADEYRVRVVRSAPFAGQVINHARNVERLLASVDPNIHHGEGMTCVWTRQTAACERARIEAGLPTDGQPDQAECRTTCQNLAYTDRDIVQLQHRVTALDATTADRLTPRPLRDRAATQATQTREIISRHERSRTTVVTREGEDA